MLPMPIFGCGMWQTPHKRHTPWAPRSGTLMGLLACATAVLLIGVVIGRLPAAGRGVDEVSLRTPQPTPPATRTAPAHDDRDRPSLDPVARAETPMAEQDVMAGKKRRAGG